MEYKDNIKKVSEQKLAITSAGVFFLPDEFKDREVLRETVYDMYKR